jgi:23S rRNA pseudouridine1911/1915/1917 synthase
MSPSQGNTYHFCVSEDNEGIRLDQLLAELLPDSSRTAIQQLIEDTQVTVNGRCEKKRYITEKEDHIVVHIPPPVQHLLTPEPMSFRILFEDASFFIIDKPAGLVVHPGPGNYSGTFVHGLIAHCQQIAGLDPIRPGIVHRLDKETSGVLVAAKTALALTDLSRQFQERTVTKEYFALVHGDLQTSHDIKEPIGRDPKFRQKMGIVPTGKFAHTTIYPLAHRNGITLVQAIPHTGRTHQIRVHLSSIGFPVIGDLLYGGKKNSIKVERHMLHCHRLKFQHPTTELPLDVRAGLPIDMQQLICETGLGYESYSAACTSSVSLR